VINRFFFPGFFFLGFLCHQRSWCQDKIFNLKKIVSIEASYPQDADLSFLDSLTKGKRIILLGEETHFDGSSLMARQRVIDYLYHRLGFNNLCLEYNFFEVNKAFLDIVKNKDSAVGVLAYLTDDFPDIISFDNLALAKTVGQAHGNFFLSGLDIIPGSIYFNAFYGDFQNFISQFINYQDSRIRTYFEKFGLKGYHNPRAMEKITSDSKKLETAIKNGEALIAELEILWPSVKKPDDKKSMSFFIQQIKSHLSYYHYLINIKRYNHESKTSYYNIYKPNEIRDKQMAKNFFWIFENSDTSSKFIISLSSFHIGRNYNNISPAPAEIDSSYNTFGDYLYEKFGNLSYSIAFISYEGHRGHPLSNLQNASFSKPDNSFEYSLHKMGYPYTFLDLSCEWNKSLLNKKKFLLQPTFERAYYSKWNESYDGFFFIDKMEPVKVRHMLNRSRKEQPYNLPAGW
jgi:erythromycin esterase